MCQLQWEKVFNRHNCSRIKALYLSEILKEEQELAYETLRTSLCVAYSKAENIRHQEQNKCYSLCLLCLAYSSYSAILLLICCVIFQVTLFLSNVCHIIEHFACCSAFPDLHTCDKCVIIARRVMMLFALHIVCNMFDFFLRVVVRRILGALSFWH